MLIQLLIAVVLLVPVSAHALCAGCFWDDEMEDSTTRFNASGVLVGSWIANGTMTFDTSVKFSGTGSLRLNYPPRCQTLTTQNQCGGAASAPITRTEDLWQRVYFRMSGSGPNVTSTGLFMPALAFTKMIKTQNGSSLPRSWAGMGENNTTRYNFHAEGVPTASRTRGMPASIYFRDNRWYCIETRQKMNTSVGGVFQADGIMTQYVDGVLVNSATDVLFRNTTISPTAQFDHVGIFRQIGEGNIWFDRWAVGTMRIGCVGTVTPGDTTPPTPPTGLTAQ